MSVRVVRMRNGEDVVADLYEVTAKEDPEKPIAFQLRHPYNLYLTEPSPVGDGQIRKLSSPEISFQPWAPFSKDNSIMIKMDEVVSAYETFQEVIDKYNELVEAVSHGGDDGSTAGSNGGPDAPAAVESYTAETETGVPVGEGDGAG